MFVTLWMPWMGTSALIKIALLALLGNICWMFKTLYVMIRVIFRRFGIRICLGLEIDLVVPVDES